MLRTLLYEYKKTRRELRGELDEICKSFEKLLKQLELDKDFPKHKEAETKYKLIKQDYNFMISNLEYAIDWIEHGREPGKMRGADRTRVYLKDPTIIDAAIKYKHLYPVDQPSKEITKIEKEMIEDAMCTLSKREKEVFLLIKVEGITFEFTGKLLNIEKTTVQNYYERAIKKIEKRKNQSLFLI